MSGRAFCFGDNVNTDLIFPKTWFRPTYAPGEMASHLLSGIDETVAAQVRPGDVLVGGANFGCGSSREEAAGAMREARVGAVVAESFSRLFTRNCINFGLPAVALPGIAAAVSDGDHVEIDFDELRLHNVTTGYEALISPMSTEILRLMESGGIGPYTRRVLAELRANGEA